MITGKCPKCDSIPSFGLKMQGANITGEDGRKWFGVIYVCPNVSCQAILGAGIDPVALKSDTVDEVVKRLGR